MRHILLCILLTVGHVSTSSAFTMGTYNIKMFDARPGMTNKAELIKILKKINYDFLSVQEIVNVSSLKKLLKENFKQYAMVSTTCGGAGRQQIAFIYDKSKFELKKSYEDHRVSSSFVKGTEQRCPNLRPVLVGHFIDKSSKEDFVMLGVHLKAGGRASSYNKRKAQYSELRKIVSEFKIKKYENILLLGDFNTTGYNLRDSDYRNFNAMLEQTDMISVAEEISCTSYWSGVDPSNGIEESSTLDHILLPKKFLGKTKSSTTVGTHCAKVACARVSAKDLGISYKEVSDHCPVVTTLY